MEKYYTPDIEDIRIGYECEVDNRYKIIGKYLIDLQSAQQCLKIGKLKTPYLTKEQIEAEGWEFVTTMTSSNEFRIPFEEVYMKKFKKGYYQFRYSNEHFASISIWDCTDNMKPIQRNLFNGECKSINELRQIQKLLGI